MRAHVLIEACPGMSAAVKLELETSFYPGAQLLSIDVVAGSYDVVALVEARDLEELGRALANRVQQVDGVVKTMTCVVFLA